MSIGNADSLIDRIHTFDRWLYIQLDLVLIKAEESNSQRRAWTYMGQYQLLLDMRVKLRALLADLMSFDAL